jgi:hypothetical protein
MIFEFSIFLQIEMEIKSINSIYDQLNLLLDDSTQVLVIQCPLKNKVRHLFSFADKRGLSSIRADSRQFPLNKDKYKCVICSKVYEEQDLEIEDHRRDKYVKCCDGESFLFLNNNDGSYDVSSCDNFKVIKGSFNCIIFSHKEIFENNSDSKNNGHDYVSGINSLSSLRYYITTPDMLKETLL